MAIRTVTSMFLAVVLMLCEETDGFLNAAPAPRLSTRATITMSASAGLTRAEAIQRAAAGSGVLAAGVLLGGSAQARAEEEMKDEVQQFAELRGQVEKKGRDEVVRQGSHFRARFSAFRKVAAVFKGCRPANTNKTKPGVS